MMVTMTAIEIRTEYAIRWDNGEVQGPVSEEFARGVKADRDLGSTVTILTREVEVRFGEWVEG